MSHPGSVPSWVFLTFYLFRQFLTPVGDDVVYWASSFTVHHPADNGEKEQEWSTAGLGMGWKQGDQQNVLLSPKKLHGSQWCDS